MEIDYYFNEWAFLAQTDPEAFERRRRDYIEQFLQSAGHRRPFLEALQATIDTERKLAGPPSESMMVLCRMMCNSLTELHLAMKDLSGDLKDLQRLGGIKLDLPPAAPPAMPPAAVGDRRPAPSIVLRRGTMRLTPRRRLSM